MGAIRPGGGGGGGGGAIALTGDTTGSGTGTIATTTTGLTFASAAVSAANRAVLGASGPVRSVLDFTGGALKSDVLASPPQFRNGCSLVLLARRRAGATISGPRILLETGSGQCQLRFGDDAGDRYRAEIYVGGFVPLPAECTFADDALHVLSLSCTGGDYRSSWDGGAVQVTAIGSTPAPISSAALVIGADTSGNYGAPQIQIADVIYYGSVLSDADLVAVAAGAVAAAEIVDTGTGTITYRLRAQDYLVGMAPRRSFYPSTAPTITLYGFAGSSSSTDVVPL